jgi:hypothetical protein
MTSSLAQNRLFIYFRALHFRAEILYQCSHMNPVLFQIQTFTQNGAVTMALERIG